MDEKEILRMISKVDLNKLLIQYLLIKVKENEAYLKYLEGFIDGLKIKNS